ncbi:MAG: hypothetical protein P4L75_01405 [Clostridia bacterium]|nr:hypothetical protein [Clostridia bacterium]
MSAGEFCAILSEIFPEGTKIAPSGFAGASVGGFCFLFAALQKESALPRHERQYAYSIIYRNPYTHMAEYSIILTSI